VVNVIKKKLDCNAAKDERFIPMTMQNTAQWCLWRREGDKKIPYSANYDGMASSTKQATWCSYEKALQEFQRGDYGGLGFIITAGWVFIDLDDCFIDGRLTALAQNVLENFKECYAERSQSGHGLHIIAKGTIPSSIKTKQIEIYGNARYCAITGEAIFANEPQDKQNEVMQLWRWLDAKRNKNKSQGEQLPHDCVCGLNAQEIIDRATNAKGGSVFAQLYQGDWQALGIGDGSQSSADLSFCNKLCFWTGGNADLMREIFESSGLYRNPRKTQLALNKALADCREYYTGRR
jgi:putative DNA primase/helicase